MPIVARKTHGRITTIAARTNSRGSTQAYRLTEKVVFGDVWERPQLSKCDRSLITCAALVALQRPDQLRGHLERALDNGVTKDELGELITHLAFYSGWPTAVTAAGIAKEIFDKRQ